ncbi:MAG: hypothetical protein Kow00109_00880 [Acidobacteriota bacterium]
MVFRVSFVPLLMGALVTASVAAEGLRTPEFLEQIQPGFDDLFNLEYERAWRRFNDLRERWPEHPGPPLYAAATVWLRELYRRQDLDLERFLSPGYFAEKTAHRMPADEERKFAELIAEAQQRCDKLLERDPGDLEVRYFQGAIEGILASFAVTIHHSVSDAFSHGKRAYRLHSEVLEADPTFYDAYMSVGLYEYVVDNLPWYIKWLAVLVGYRGSEERGFEYLQLAATRGVFVKDDAKVLQMVLFVREKRFHDALRIAQELHTRYPANWLLHLNQAQILEWLGDADAAAATYEKVWKYHREGRPRYADMARVPFLLALGRKFRAFGRLQEAQAFLHQAMQEPEEDLEIRAKLHLETGKTFDLQGNRAAAQEHYRLAEELARDSSLRKEAAKYRKRAFRPGDDR